MYFRPKTGQNVGTETSSPRATPTTLATMATMPAADLKITVDDEFVPEEEEGGAEAYQGDPSSPVRLTQGDGLCMRKARRGQNRTGMTLPGQGQPVNGTVTSPQ